MKTRTLLPLILAGITIFGAGAAIVPEASASPNHCASKHRNRIPNVANTRVQTIVHDRNRTVALGGLREVETNASVDRVPVLHRIPFLGKLFRNRAEAKANSETIIMVTPRVVVQEE